MKNIEVKEDRTLPADGICRYCGGDIWLLKDGRLMCGHCLREYNRKGAKNVSNSDE